MRVLHLMECTIGGTRRHLVDVALGQRDLGYEVGVVVSTLRDESFPPDLERMRAAGVKVHVLDMLRRPAPWTDFRHLGQIKIILRNFRPEIVHTHSSKAGVLGRQASISTGIGVRVHTPHTFSFLFEALFSAPKRWIYRTIEQHYAKSTQTFVAVGSGEAETFAKAGFIDPAKVAVVSNGIDPKPYATAMPSEENFGLDPNGPLVILVGLIYAAKGQDLALAALAEAGLEQVQLLCVGPGDTSELKAQAKALGVTERVRFLGPRNDVPALMARADLLLLPSRWEGLPYVVLEAMARGMPVVATPVDGAREVVLSGVTGFLSSAINAPSVAAALREALAKSREEWAQMGRAGQERVAKHYSLDSMVRGLDRVYLELL